MPVAPGAAATSVLEAAKSISAKAEREPYKPQPLLPFEDLDEAVHFALVDDTPMVALANPADPTPFGKLDLLSTTATSQATKLTIESLQAAMPTPEQPKVAVWPERQYRQEQVDVVTAHVAMLYPWQQLRDAWQQASAHKHMAPKVVMMSVEAQVQELGPDGWTEARPVQAASRPPMDVSGQLVPVVPIPDYTLETAAEVQAAILQYVQGLSQTVALEPDFWDIFDPKSGRASWLIHLPYTEVSDLPVDNMYGYGPPDHLGQPNFMEAKPVLSTTAKPGKMAVDAGLPLPVPTLGMQMVYGKVLGWVHDVMLENSKTYRYRTRVIALNPFFAQDGAFDDAAMVSIKTLASPWSDWSEPAAVPNQMEYFITGASENLNSVSATVFTRQMGQWVSYPFTITPGQAIGGRAEVNIPDPNNPGARTKIPVDFQTGTVLVSVDFTKKVYRGGPAGLSMSQATEIVLVDSLGRLRTRIVEIDKSSPRYTELERQVKQGAPPPPQTQPKAEPTPVPNAVGIKQSGPTHIPTKEEVDRMME